MRDAVLMVSPKNEKCGIFVPTTPAKAGPQCTPMRSRMWPAAMAPPHASSSASIAGRGPADGSARCEHAARVRTLARGRRMQRDTSSISVASASMRAAWLGASSLPDTTM